MKVGFKPSWILQEEEQQEQDEQIPVFNPVQNISTEAEKVPSLEEMYAGCSQAHLEVKKRMIEVVAVISGKKYSTYSQEKKIEFANELIWLTSLDAELSIKNG